MPSATMAAPANTQSKPTSNRMMYIAPSRPVPEAIVAAPRANPRRCSDATPGLFRSHPPDPGVAPSVLEPAESSMEEADVVLVARPSLSVRCARALHVAGNARIPSRQASPGLREQRQ